MFPTDSETQVEVIDAAEVDTLTQIEERVRRAVTLVASLREERDAALQALAEAKESAAQAEAQAEAAQRTLSEEISALKTDRKQVRERLERLLGHIDQLGEA